MKEISIKVEYFTGLDLGQPNEFTALAVVERNTRREKWDGPWSQGNYAVRYLKRFPLGTPYPVICQDLQQLFATRSLVRSTLVVDQSAVGRPILELLKRAQLNATLRPLAVTAGHKAGWSDGILMAPKQELIGTLQVLLQTRRLRLASTLAEAQLLVQELLNFKMKVSVSATDPVAAWREGPNDDLVLATGIAAWMGERCPPKQVFVPQVLCGPRFLYR